MTREQAEKWIANHKKKPNKVCWPAGYYCDVFFWQENSESENKLPSEVYRKLTFDHFCIIKYHTSEAEAIEDLIQALMKTYPDEVEIDPHAMGMDYGEQMEEKEMDKTLKFALQRAWVAGFKAAQKEFS